MAFLDNGVRAAFSAIAGLLVFSCTGLQQITIQHVAIFVITQRRVSVLHVAVSVLVYLIRCILNYLNCGVQLKYLSYYSLPFYV